MARRNAVLQPHRDARWRGLFLLGIASPKKLITGNARCAAPPERADKNAKRRKAFQEDGRFKLFSWGLEHPNAFFKFSVVLTFGHPGVLGRIELKETAMRKIHAALLAGAVVVGLGAVVGLAAF